MLRSKKMFSFLGIISVITIILRTLLIINNTDDAGLYINLQSNVILWLNFILIISSAGMFILPFFDDMPEENRSRNKDKLLGISMACFGGVIMFVGLVEFFTILQLVWSGNIKEMQYFLFNTPNALMKIITSLISFITGWMTAMLAIKVLNNKPIYNNYGVSVMFIIWAIMRAMLFTKVNTTVVSIADNLYSIITIICSILFLFGVSEILFDIKIKTGYKIAVSSGNLLIIYGLLKTVPNYIAIIMHENTFFSIKDTNGITDIMLSLFAVIFLYIIIFSKGENKKLFDRSE